MDDLPRLHLELDRSHAHAGSRHRLEEADRPVEGITPRRHLLYEGRTSVSLGEAVERAERHHPLLLDRGEGEVGIGRLDRLDRALRGAHVGSGIFAPAHQRALPIGMPPDPFGMRLVERRGTALEIVVDIGLLGTPDEGQREGSAPPPAEIWTIR